MEIRKFTDTQVIIVFGLRNARVFLEPRHPVQRNRAISVGGKALAIKIFRCHEIALSIKMSPSSTCANMLSGKRSFISMRTRTPSSVRVEYLYNM